MKKFLIVVLFVCGITCLTYSQQSDSIKEVAAAVEMLNNGIINADKGLLESITADQLIYAHSGGKVQNKSEFISEVVSLEPNDYLIIDLTDQTITISGDVAVVRHIFSAGYTSKGVAGNLKVGNTLIWQKQQGKWKLFARQAYKL